MNTDQALDRAADLLSHARRLLIGTGAGLSVESGIPTYRSPGRAPWRDYGRLSALGIRAEDLACPSAFEEDPAAAWGVLEWKRRLVAEATPHVGYEALHALGRSTDSFVQTTNVDGLHTRAGWPPERLHEVHGSLWRLQCTGPCSRAVWDAPHDPDRPWVDLDEDTLRARAWPRCEGCARPTRPHALLFGDLDYLGDPDAEARRRAFHEAGPDVVLVVGESGVIPTHLHDAQTLQRERGARAIVIDSDPEHRAARWADAFLPLSAQSALVALRERVLGTAA